jgi:hypothetical protein
MTEDPEVIVATALAGMVGAYVGTCPTCEELRRQLVAFLFLVPVPLSPTIPKADPDCQFCRVVQWALTEVLSPQALDCLEAEVQVENPLAIALWDCCANPGVIL